MLNQTDMPELDKLYYINVGKNGTFRPSGNSVFDTTPEDVDKMIQKLSEENQKRILLYFHGGLVNASNGMETATRIVKYAAERSTSHPICFVWETGLNETLFQNLDTIKKSDFFKKLLVKIIKVAGKQLGIDLDNVLGGSKGVGSMSDAEIKVQLEKEAPFEKTVVNEGKRSASLKVAPEKIKDELYYEFTVKPEVELALEEEITNDPQLVALASQQKYPDEARLMKNSIADTPQDGEKGILTYGKLLVVAVKITVAIIKRHMQKRDHGFYPTIIEEILRKIYVADTGAWVWGSMKTKAKNMWKEDDFTGASQDWHAGTYLIKKLIEYQEAAGELTIDIVGHSAGSIATCELIDAVAKRGIGLKFRNILFMAPACRCELFADTILSHQELFQKLRIFTMLDSYEQKDHLVSVLYPRSLLYFISGVLESDSVDAFILGLQRQIIGNKPYDGEPVLNKINGYLVMNDRIIYSVTDNNSLEGMRSASVSHGGFDNQDEPTLDSIFHLLK